MLDFHNHLIPGVDDGAASIEDSRIALATMQAQGIRTVVTTPHIRASLQQRPAEFDAYMKAVDAGWATLRALATAEFPRMRVERGFEVNLDIPRPDLSDPRLRLGGTPFALVEFPSFTIPLNSTQVLFDLKMAGYTAIIAHPERYVNLTNDRDRVERWRGAGSLLQINAGSLIGQYGSGPRNCAWSLLESGWADFMCSDYHARGECATERACRLLRERGGDLQVRLLTCADSGGTLEGLEPAEVPPLRRPKRRWFRFGS